MVNTYVSTCMLGEYKVQLDGIGTLSGDWPLVSKVAMHGCYTTLGWSSQKSKLEAKQEIRVCNNVLLSRLCLNGLYLKLVAYPFKAGKPMQAW